MTKNTRPPFGVKTNPIALLAIGLLWTCLAQSQESVNGTGGDATGSGGTVAYSIGQVFYTTSSGNTGSVASGVQQSYVISNVDIKEIALNISLTAFPNPTTDILTLQVDELKFSTLSFQLYDMQGKQISSAQIVAQQTQINMNSLPTATYFLNVVDQENKKVQSFKIVKQ
jgi:hypothetical protein